MSMEYTGTEASIMACSDCNNSCKHCYISYNGNLNGEELFDLCNKLSSRYKITINGTELLLHPEYFDSIQYNRQIGIITNGLQIVRNPRIVEKIVKAGIIYVGISYHFFIHESISGINRNVVQEAIDLLNNAGIITEIRTTLDVHNYDKVFDMCRQAILMRTRGIKFTNYMRMGAALNLDKENILSDKQIEYFFDELEFVRMYYDKTICKIRRCGSFGKSNTLNFCCPAGVDSVVITPDLNVYPCFFLARSGYEIGRVYNGKIVIEKRVNNNGEFCIAKEVINRRIPFETFFS